MENKHFGRCMEYYAAGELEECIAGLKRMVSMQTRDGRVYYLLGNACARQGKHEEAIQAFRQCSELMPSASEPLANMGNSLMELRRYKEAEEAFAAALRINPNDAVARNNIEGARALLSGHGVVWNDLPPEEKERLLQTVAHGTPPKAEAILRKAERITGDRSVNTLQSETTMKGSPKVIFRGSRGWYEAVEIPGKGVIVLLAHEDRPPSDTNTAGCFTDIEQDADKNAAHLLNQVFPDLPPCEFDHAYVSRAEDGVNVKWYNSGSHVVVFLTQRKGLETEAEVQIEGAIVAFRIDAKGRLQDLRQVETGPLSARVQPLLGAEKPTPVSPQPVRVVPAPPEKPGMQQSRTEKKARAMESCAICHRPLQPGEGLPAANMASRLAGVVTGADDFQKFFNNAGISKGRARQLLEAGIKASSEMICEECAKQFGAGHKAGSPTLHGRRVRITVWGLVSLVTMFGAIYLVIFGHLPGVPPTSVPETPQESAEAQPEEITVETAVLELAVPASSKPAREARALKFQQNSFRGAVYVRDWGSSGFGTWECVREDVALSDGVAIPEGKEVKLLVTRTPNGDLSFLDGFEPDDVQVLSVMCPKVGDKSLTHLKRMSGLTSLTLRDTAVTDAGLEQLAEVVSLRELILSGKGLTDAGLAHLVQLKGLQYLDVSETGVTDGGVAELAKTLPNCRFRK